MLTANIFGRSLFSLSRTFLESFENPLLYFQEISLTDATPFFSRKHTREGCNSGAAGLFSAHFDTFPKVLTIISSQPEASRQPKPPAKPRPTDTLKKISLPASKSRIFLHHHSLDSVEMASLARELSPSSFPPVYYSPKRSD